MRRFFAVGAFGGAIPRLGIPPAPAGGGKRLLAPARM